MGSSGSWSLPRASAIFSSSPCLCSVHQPVCKFSSIAGLTAVRDRHWPSSRCCSTGTIHAGAWLAQPLLKCQQGDGQPMLLMVQSEVGAEGWESPNHLTHHSVSSHLSSQDRVSRTYGVLCVCVCVLACTDASIYLDTCKYICIGRHLSFYLLFCLFTYLFIYLFIAIGLIFLDDY